MAYSPVQNYKEQAIKTMTSGELLVLLLDEAVKNLHASIMMYDNKNFETFKKCLQKSKDIFFYLSNILDSDYDISSDLYAIYDFIGQQIMKADLKKDKKPIEEILPIVEDLRNTWTEANKIITKENA